MLRRKRSFGSLLATLAFFAVIALSLNAVRAAITFAGNVEPNNPPTNWGPTINGYVGHTSNGTLTITSGSPCVLSAMNAYVGYNQGITGTASIDGSGSQWNMAQGLCVGYTGRGSLSVTGGAHVNNTTSVTGYGTIGYTTVYGSGTVTVDGGGSQWNTWILDVGSAGTGSLSIANGGAVGVTNTTNHLLTPSGIGIASGSNGTVTVDGAGGASALNVSADFFVGDYGYGTLNIYNHGAVSVATQTYVGYQTSSLGTIDFGANGGTLTTGGLTTVSSDLKGTGTIVTHGLLSNVSLVFDAAHGGNVCSFTLNGTGQNIAVTVDTSDPNHVGDLGLGYSSYLSDNSTLQIGAGTVVNCANGYLGYSANANNTATVDGAGAKWLLGYSDRLFVGYQGTGVINITGGGEVGGDTSDAWIGGLSGSHGTVTVSGTGSRWHTNGFTALGYYSASTGVLAVSNGGTADCGGLLVGPTSSVTVDGNGSTLTSPGDFTLNGPLSITGGGAVVIGGDSTVTIGSATTINISGAGSKLEFQPMTTTIGSGPGLNGTCNLTNGGILAFARSVGVGGTLSIDGGTLRTSGLDTTDGTNWGPPTFAGNVYIKAGGVTVDTNGYGMVIGAPLQHGGSGVDGGLTKVGAGTLALWSNCNDTYTGPTIVQAGTLELWANWGDAYSGAQQAHVFGTGAPGVDVRPSAKLCFAVPFDYADPDDGYSSPADGVKALLVAGYASGFTSGPIRTTSGMALGWREEVWYTYDSGAYYDTRGLSDEDLGNGGFVRVTVMSTLFGDANLDGTVNGADLNTVLSNYNKTGMDWSEGDFNYDGTVNGADLNMVLSNYNQSLSVGAAVPEPSTLLLAAAGLVGLLAYAWKKRR